MRAKHVGIALGLAALLAACAPTIEAEPVPGVKVKVPVEVPMPQGATAVETGGGKRGSAGPVIKVLPGNPLPPPGEVFRDDFSRYPTGAVLPVVNPKEYGLLKLHRDWQKATIVEAFDPSGKLDKAVRMEEGYLGGFLTTGAQDWTDYEVRLRIKVEKAPSTESAVRFRLFLDGAGSRALELALGYEGLRLDKLAGEQRFTLIERRELRETGRAFLRDGNWHDLRFLFEASGRVRFWLDETLLVDWTDPDYRAGGFGVGPKGVIFFLDDLEIHRAGPKG